MKNRMDLPMVKGNQVKHMLVHFSPMLSVSSWGTSWRVWVRLTEHYASRKNIDMVGDGKGYL